MNTFPLTRPVHRPYYKKSIFRKQLRTNFENGAVQTRPLFTRPKRTWTIGWKNLSFEEYQTLEAFFYENIGKKFLWTAPDDRVEYTVSFSQDFISAKILYGLVYDTGEIKIEERI